MHSNNLACNSAATGEASICRPTFEPRTERYRFVCFDPRGDWYRYCIGNKPEKALSSDAFIGVGTCSNLPFWEVPILRKCPPLKLYRTCARVPVALVYMTP